jgi:hypothetical protein
MPASPENVLERATLYRNAPAAGTALGHRVRTFLAVPGRRLDLLCATLAVCYALPALFYPHGNDQALHWYVGQGILRGELPFVGAISAKPVGIFVVHALSSLLFGPGQAAIRVADLLTLCACASLVAAVSRPSGQGRSAGEIGLAAIVLFGLYYTYFDYWDQAHPELWESTLSLAGTVIASGDGRLRRRAFWVGLCSTLALMFKHTAVVLTLPLAGYLVGRALERRPIATAWRSLLREVALPYALGSVVVLAACVLPYAVAGQLRPMWEVLFTAVLRYAEKAPGPDGIPDWFCLEYGGSALIATGVALIAGRIVSHRRGREDDVQRGVLLLGMTVAAIASVVLQYRFYTYHFVVVAPWLAASMVWGLRMLWPRDAERPIVIAVGLVVIAFAAGPWWRSCRDYTYHQHFANLASYLAGKTSRWEYLAPFSGQNRLDSYRVLESIGKEIKKRARPGDTLCVRGFAPPIYQVSGLRCPSRHVVQARVTLPGWDEEYADLVVRNPPRFIVTFRDRPDDIRNLGQRGYRARPSPKWFMVMELPPRVPKRHTHVHRPAPVRRVRRQR